MSQSKTGAIIHKVHRSMASQFLNHHCSALNSGVRWGSRNQRDSTVGNSTPVSQGKYLPKNQPGHRLASFKICISHTCPEPLVAKPDRNLQVRCCWTGPYRPSPPWAASRCVGAHRVLFCIMSLCFHALVWATDFHHRALDNSCWCTHGALWMACLPPRM